MKEAQGAFVGLRRADGSHAMGGFGGVGATPTDLGDSHVRRRPVVGGESERSLTDQNAHAYTWSNIIIAATFFVGQALIAWSIWGSGSAGV